MVLETDGQMASAELNWPTLAMAMAPRRTMPGSCWWYRKTKEEITREAVKQDQNSWSPLLTEQLNRELGLFP